jgi:GWxTD domain-containing protein
MKKSLIFVFLGIVLGGHSQSLHDVNYSYLYNPDESFTFYLKPVRQAASWKILYGFHVKDTAQRAQYSTQWEARESLNDREGVVLTQFDSAGVKHSPHGLHGIITINATDAPKILVAKVMNNLAKTYTLFYAHLEQNYPVNNYLVSSDTPVYQSFIGTSESVSLSDVSSSWTVSYYNDNFPSAAPAFSEGMAKVSKSMDADSVFFIGQVSTNFSRKGLYLIQKDTNTAEGLALRAEDDYPRFTKLQNLAEPFIYICTKSEYDRIVLAKGNKKAFDRIILSITNDTERAKKIIRNYFRRVELANQYFTSYKEGWKTDRGMIYIIFGLPEEVFRFSDREVWVYKNEMFRITFNFTKSSSVFDPDNYVLVRDKKFQQTWYEVIDLWRNARF